MLETGGERDGEQASPFLDDSVPFSAPSSVAVRPVFEPSSLDTIVDLTHRWRVPLSLLLGVVLSGIIYVAYQTRDGEEIVSPGTVSLTPSTAGTTAVGTDDGADDEPDEIVNGPLTAAATESDADSGSVSESAAATTSTTAVSTTAETSPPAPSSTAPPSSSTTTEPTTTTTAAPQPASVVGTVSFDADGQDVATDQKVKSLEVRLIPESDDPRDVVFTTVDGTYRFEAEPACYQVRFIVPKGQKAVAGEERTSLCLEPGQNVNLDLTITWPEVVAPQSCEIQIGDGSGAGVELYDRKERWADSYAFYGESGQFVLSTYGLGPADDLDAGEPSIEWTSDVNGFEESDVYSVAAEHPQGVTSERVQCSRRGR